MKILGLLSIITALLLVFQNCGESSRNSTVMTSQLLQSSVDDCQGVECDAPEELLWLKIREYEPYKIEFRSITAGHFNIGGQCGIGLFPVHSFVYELRKSFGDEAVIGRGFVDNRCDLGQFSVPVSANLNIPLEPNKRYRVSLELIGIDANGEEFTNPMPHNKGSLDVILTDSSGT